MTKKITLNILVFLFYLMIAILFFGLYVMPHLNNYYIGLKKDPQAYIWFIHWWPYALKHHLNPLFTQYLWAPLGYNITKANTIPLLSLIMSPITYKFGSFVSYNLLSLIAPALSAYTAYILCKYTSKSFFPSIIGGYLFGFSTYQITHTLAGHICLTAIFIVPLILFLVLLRWDKKISASLFTTLISLCFICQFLISTEIFLTSAIFLATLTIIAWFLYKERRNEIKHMTLLLIISYIITTIIISPYLYYFFTDKNNTLIDKQRLHYNNDLLSFFVPLPIQLLGGKFFNGLTNKFLTSNMFEKNAYLGFPLIIIIILFCKEFWRKNNTRFLFYTMIITALLSLGSMLQLAGYKIFLFPWYNFYSMPILYHLLPCRLIMYTTLIISIMIAIWLKKSKMKSLWKYTLLFCAIVFLLPNTMSKQTPSFTKTPLPVFMQKNNYKKLIPKNAIVLFLPQYPMGNAYDELLWQLQSDMYFKLAQGNIGGIPEYFFSNKFLQPFYAPKLGTTCPQETILPTNAYKQLKEFIDNNNINTIIIKDKSLNKQYKQILAKLNLIPVKMGNFLIYQT